MRLSGSITLRRRQQGRQHLWIFPVG
jgi:hypothetical protein